MTKNYYVSGGWNCICDRCGKKKKISEVNREWTGFLVCNTCFEERHPQDFVRAKQDKISVRETRPIPTLVFVNIDSNDYWDIGYTMKGYIDGDDI